MNVIFYEPTMNGRVKRIPKIIEGLNLDCGLEIYQTLDSLSHRLSQSTEKPTIAVLFATSKDDLLDILSIEDLLRGIRIILVLPDRDSDTIAKGHTLRPRFLTFADSDLGEVSAVVGKRLRNSYREKNLIKER